jgi:hypothetical protein
VGACEAGTEGFAENYDRSTPLRLIKSCADRPPEIDNVEE